MVANLSNVERKEQVMLLIIIGAILIAKGIHDFVNDNRNQRRLSPYERALEELDRETRSISSKADIKYLGSSTYRRR